MGAEHPIVQDAVEGLGLELDDRGLIELEQARAMLAAVQEFRRGAGSEVDGRWVWSSDRLWGALLSLDDADEFVREASRLE